MSITCEVVSELQWHLSSLLDFTILRQSSQKPSMEEQSNDIKWIETINVFQLVLDNIIRKIYLLDWNYLSNLY